VLSKAPAGACLFAFLLGSSVAGGQSVSDIEPERPVSVEDAKPVPYRAFSASLDWTYNLRSGGINDQGPGIALLYGAARGVELGGALRYVTRPGRNALRGIASGDLHLHGLVGLAAETRRFPAVAIRVGVAFPTGLDSRGTDLELAALLTRSFDAFRLHGNLRWTRLGDTLAPEKPDRFEGILGVDVVPGWTGTTDTVLLFDVAARSNAVREGETVVELGAGARQRIGMSTVFFVGLGSETSGGRDRTRFRARGGLTHLF